MEYSRSIAELTIEQDFALRVGDILAGCPWEVPSSQNRQVRQKFLPLNYSQVRVYQVRDFGSLGNVLNTVSDPEGFFAQWPTDGSELSEKPTEYIFELGNKLMELSELRVNSNV